MRPDHPAAAGSSASRSVDLATPAAPGPVVLSPDPATGSGAESGPQDAVLAQLAGEVVSAEGLLTWRRRLLREGGASADLDWLLDLAGGLGWGELQRLWLQPQRQVALQCRLSELEAIWRCHRRGGGPLQYLVGRTPWRDLELAVGPGVLIPRQETELMVELLLQAHRGDRRGTVVDNPLPGRPAPALWADLGTGSGCLAIALAQAFSESAGLAVEVSHAALAQAAHNLEQLALNQRVRLLQGSWWQPLRPWWGQLELVVANPPYIPSSLIAELDPIVRDHEPTLALDGGADGLDCLRTIVAQAPQALAPGGLLLVEHHHDQSRPVLAMMEVAGLQHPQAHRDLEGVLRFASASQPLAAPCDAVKSSAFGPQARDASHRCSPLPGSRQGGLSDPR